MDDTEIRIVVLCLAVVAMVTAVLGCWGLAIAIRGWIKPDETELRIRSYLERHRK